MPLSENEQRLLEQMERALYAEDPKWASAMRGAVRRSSGARRLLLGISGIVLGLVLLLVGVAQQLVIVGIVGFVVMLAALAYTVSSRRKPGPQASSTAPAASGRSPPTAVAAALSCSASRSAGTAAATVADRTPHGRQRRGPAGILRPGPFRCVHVSGNGGGRGPSARASTRRQSPLAPGPPGRCSTRQSTRQRLRPDPTNLRTSSPTWPTRPAARSPAPSIAASARQAAPVSKPGPTPAAGGRAVAGRRHLLRHDFATALTSARSSRASGPVAARRRVARRLQLARRAGRAARCGPAARAPRRPATAAPPGGSAPADTGTPRSASRSPSSSNAVSAARPGWMPAASGPAGRARARPPAGSGPAARARRRRSTARSARPRPAARGTARGVARRAGVGLVLLGEPGLRAGARWWPSADADALALGTGSGSRACCSTTSRHARGCGRPGRLEPHPAVALEVQLRPGVRVPQADRPGTRRAPCVPGRKPDDHARRDVQGARHDRHGGGEVDAVAALLLQELQHGAAAAVRRSRCRARCSE